MSNNLNFPVVTGLSSGKEATIDQIMGYVDAVLTEQFEADVNAGNVVLTNAQYRYNALINITNAGTAGRTVTVPAIKRSILVQHKSGANSVNLVRGSTSVALNPAGVYIAITDGTTNGMVVLQVTAAGPVIFGSVNDQTDDYTLVLTDAFKHIRMNHATGKALTVPPNGTVAFPVGTKVFGNVAGAGTCTITAGAGVTINSANGLSSHAQHEGFILTKTATDTWNLTWIGYDATASAGAYPTLVTENASATLTKASHAGKYVKANNGSAMTLTVDADADSAWDADTEISGIQYGAGQVTIAVETGSLRLPPGANAKTSGQYAMFFLKRLASDEWALSGDLEIP